MWRIRSGGNCPDIGRGTKIGVVWCDVGRVHFGLSDQPGDITYEVKSCCGVGNDGLGGEVVSYDWWEMSGLWLRTENSRRIVGVM